MRRGSRATGDELDPRYGERFWFAVALAAVAGLSLTADLAVWTRALCWVAIAVGAAAAVHFGRRHLVSRSARR